MITLAVLGFQLVIFGSIVVAGKVGGKILATLVAGLWCVWTIHLIFMPWLLHLQFTTIGLAWLVAMGITSEDTARSQLKSIRS